jgi:hypothetical protein
MLRLPLRGAHERRYLASAAHEHLQRQLAELGRMVGSWAKHAERRHAPRLR